MRTLLTATAALAFAAGAAQAEPVTMKLAAAADIVAAITGTGPSKLAPIDDIDRTAKSDDGKEMSVHGSNYSVTANIAFAVDADRLKPYVTAYERERSGLLTSLSPAAKKWLDAQQQALSPLVDPKKRDELLATPLDDADRQAIDTMTKQLLADQDKDITVDLQTIKQADLRLESNHVPAKILAAILPIISDIPKPEAAK